MDYQTIYNDRQHTSAVNETKPILFIFITPLDVKL